MISNPLQKTQFAQQNQNDDQGSNAAEWCFELIPGIAVGALVGVATFFIRLLSGNGIAQPMCEGAIVGGGACVLITILFKKLIGGKSSKPVQKSSSPVQRCNQQQPVPKQEDWSVQFQKQQAIENFESNKQTQQKLDELQQSHSVKIDDINKKIQVEIDKIEKSNEFIKRENPTEKEVNKFLGCVMPESWTLENAKSAAQIQARAVKGSSEISLTLLNIEIEIENSSFNSDIQILKNRLK